MSSFPILDLVIGMIFIYFLFSIICSSAVELWFSILNTRANLLTKWIVQIFDKPALNSDGTPAKITVGQSIVDHCMVTALSKTGKSTSYIDAENFVSAFLDKITLKPTSTAADQLPPANLPEYITAIQNSTAISGELKRTILSFANEASLAVVAIKTVPAVAGITNNISTEIKSDMDIFQEKLEKWYDSNAQRITGTLKRKKALPATFILGTILTIALNVNTIEISKYLYSNKDQSAQLATTAMNSYEKLNDKISATNTSNDSITDSTTIKNLTQQADDLKSEIDSLNKLNLPIGWTSTPVKDFTTFTQYIHWPTIFGWLATILAICMGAPFWFDLLNKIANVRGVGPKPASGSDANNKNN
ncbi:MAG: hypothetical protein ABJB05_10915 [Parafilimonas sp.]